MNVYCLLLIACICSHVHPCTIIAVPVFSAGYDAWGKLVVLEGVKLFCSNCLLCFWLKPQVLSVNKMTSDFSGALDDLPSHFSS